MRDKWYIWIVLGDWSICCRIVFGFCCVVMLDFCRYKGGGWGIDCFEWSVICEGGILVGIGGWKMDDDFWFGGGLLKLLNLWLLVDVVFVWLVGYVGKVFNGLFVFINGCCIYRGLCWIGLGIGGLGGGRFENKGGELCYKFVGGCNIILLICKFVGGFGFVLWL